MKRSAKTDRQVKQRQQAMIFIQSMRLYIYYVYSIYWTWKIKTFRWHWRQNFKIGIHNVSWADPREDSFGNQISEMERKHKFLRGTTSVQHFIGFPIVLLPERCHIYFVWADWYNCHVSFSSRYVKCRAMISVSRLILKQKS